MTKAQVEGLNNHIIDLEAELVDTKDQLDGARREVEYRQGEHQRLATETTYHGEQYESVRAQLKNMQVDRQEMERQLNASKGRIELAKDRTEEVQKLLDKERQTNANLRNRHYWHDLDEEKKEAMRMFEAASREKEYLQTKIVELLNHIKDQEQHLAALGADLEAARSATEDEKRQQVILHRELANISEERDRAQSSADELQSQLEGIMAAAKRVEERPLVPHKPSSNYVPRRPTAGSIEDLDRGHPAASSQHASPDPADEGMVMIHKSDLASPLEPRSPLFRTIHGNHRADGSLGGWKNDTTRRHDRTGSMYESSVRNVAVGDIDQHSHSQSTESVHSAEHAVTTAAGGLNIQNGLPSPPPPPPSAQAQAQSPTASRPGNGSSQRPAFFDKLRRSK